jgi:hypothetical protein
MRGKRKERSSSLETDTSWYTKKTPESLIQSIESFLPDVTFSDGGKKGDPFFSCLESQTGFDTAQACIPRLVVTTRCETPSLSILLL